MKKTNVAFLVCALMALIMCVAPVSALAYEGSDLASTGEKISSAEGSRNLEGGDAENDAQTGNKSPDAGLLNSMRERPARYAYGAGGVDNKSSAGLVSAQGYDQGSLEYLNLRGGVTFDARLDQRYSTEEGDVFVPVRFTQVESHGANNEIRMIDEGHNAVANLIGNNRLDQINGVARQQLYVYPINSTGYEAMAKAS
jgi:hypothetical protein